MAQMKSLDDLKTAHLHFTSAIEPVLATLPEHYAAEKAALDAAYAELLAASKARTCVGVKRATDLQQRKAWAAKADAALSRLRFYLRGTAPGTLREYFPEPAGACSRAIDRLHAIAKALTVSEHFSHAHLGAFREELEALRAEGEPIFGAASNSVTEQKTEVERLNALRARWERIYQKLKFLVRGYYHDSSTDWAKFFDEKRMPRLPQAREADKAPVPAAPQADLAS